MKKTIAIVLAAVLLTLMFTACSVNTVDDDIIGTWESARGDQAGSFVFNVGGGGKILSGEDTAEITWSEKDGKLSISIEETVLIQDAAFTVNATELTITYNGITEVFTRKK